MLYGQRLWRYAWLYAANGDGTSGGGDGDGKGKEGDGDTKGKEGGDGKEGDGKGDGKEGDNTPKTLEDALKLVATLTSQLEETNKTLKRTNAESAGRRKELERIEAEKREGEKSKLSEAERTAQEKEELTKENTTLKTKLKGQAIAFEVARHAGKLGFYDPDDAAKLVDLSKVEYDEESGTVTGVEDAVKALAAKKPHLLADDKKVDAKDIDARKSGKGGGKTDAKAQSRAMRFGLKK